jgi:alpha-D-xyloside xylohydrolase
VKLPQGDPYIGQWWKGTGSLIDFTNPAARDWWQGQVRKAIRAGADGFKADDAEGGFIGDVRFASGEDSRLLRNRYAVLYNQALEELIQKDLHGDGVLFMRSVSVGNHNLPFAWGGDNEANFSAENGLPSVVIAGLNAGMSGISLWGTDLGAYFKSKRTPDDARLFIRWSEYSAFSPVMQVMSQLNIGPWDYGDQALTIYRQYSVLHMSLFPYRYAAAQESARTGLPMMRSLVLMHQDDETARQTIDEYYFGPDFLVAPVVTGANQRSVYLPAGDWLDYWSGERIQGPATRIVDAPLGRAPLYVRAGAIIPKIPEDVMTLVQSEQVRQAGIHALDDRRVYEVYPGPPRSVTDFEDRTIATELGKDGNSLNISGKAARITVRWKFHPPKSVKLNGAPITLHKGSGSDGAYVEWAHGGTSRLTYSSSP